ncbi:MAG: hypothetical protein K1X55_01620 [Chitinophagales bacterium]|nr:hypothetical protein [Chitinophagales bacterium]
MDQIKDTVILDAFDKLDKLDENQYEAFFDNLANQQPIVFGYLMEFAESLEREEASEDMVFLLAIIYISYTDMKGGEVPHITEEILDEAEEKVISLLQELESIEEEDAQFAFIEKHQTQPDLMEYCNDILGGDEEYPSSFSEEEMGLAYTNLKVIIEAFEIATA